jgi:hypothetical protein
VFSPLVANQEPTRPRTEGTRIDTWSLVIDENELRFLSHDEIATGNSLVWKLAAWGSELDRTILRRTTSLKSLGKLVDSVGFSMSEGMQLRRTPAKDDDPAEHHPELAGKLTIDLPALAGARLLFAFPKNALVPIPPDLTWVRIRGGFTLPEQVSRPPHILVNAARNWAVYSNQYIIVPARQIGIAGKSADALLLKALALYLNSEFVQYHQFFASTQSGVKREVSTLRALRSLPVPDCLIDGDRAVIEKWAELHDELAECDATVPPINAHAHEDKKNALLTRLNKTINATLHLRDQDRIRIADFVNVQLGLRDGKVEERAVRRPKDAELRAYAERLKRDLDAFIGREAGVQHGVEVWHGEHAGVIQINLLGGNGSVTVHPSTRGAEVTKQVAGLQSLIGRGFSQWRYFNRNLRIFAEGRVYLFKPMQRFHWVESQAIQDAGEVVGLVLHRVPTPA